LPQSPCRAAEQAAEARRGTRGRAGRLPACVSRSRATHSLRARAVGGSFPLAKNQTTMKMDVEFGLIEGFYGRPWSWEERAGTIETLAPHGYRFYLYAPKADPYLRKRWKEPHPDMEL